jgi:hypothetical protein
MEISYRCYCACGGAANPRLYSLPRRDSRGDLIGGFTYHDSGDGPLTAWPTNSLTN